MHMHNTLTENEISWSFEELRLLVRFELSRSSEELRLLVRFVETLLSDKIGQKGSEDSWTQIIEDVTDDSPVSSRTTNWLLEELLKDKLETWLSSKFQDNNTLPVLSKGEQGIIHMISGEKMVAELLASGAYPGAVTDPSQQDPTGKTPASIAETYGHKGLAGYLSEVGLTSHLSSLTLKESELSKCSADVEAERTVNSISNQNLVVEDHLSLKDAIAAVRNAAQAASRIQAAFRAHSFKKRKQKVAAERDGADEYGILPSEIEALSAVSKLTFGNARHHNAALAIQKKYRGWKGRKDYLTLRKKVVKIQAHVRGHQARKNYEAICWAVGIVEKIILRWHRKRVGLRGFHLDSIDESADEEIAKVFRKQRVDIALAEAVSRVLSMVNSTPARQQYRRMLQKYQQAKAEQGGWENEGGTSQLETAAGMETEELLDFV
ncbi:ankyrin repeat-containing protein [Tanacetum coccineum]